MCIGIACAAGLAIAAAAAAPALADGSGLSVSSLGQPSVPVIDGQPPVGVGPSGTCTEPFTLETACRPGTWPALGGGWGPTVDVAGGDTLALTFASPVTAVSVASTSNYMPGLSTPSVTPPPGAGAPAAPPAALVNYDVLPATAATATSDPRTWHIALPELDVRAMSGYTFSVVGTDATGPHDYALTIRSPRYADETRRCGTAYYNTGLSQYLCPAESVPPGTPRHGPSGPPQPHRSLAVFSVARFAHGRLRLRFTAPMPGTLRVKLTVPQLGDRTIVRRVRAAGDITVTTTLRSYRPTKASRIAVVAHLRASGRQFGIAKTIAVT